MAIYESDHTKFMREWLRQHPEELEAQKRGRALWWGEPMDQEQPRGDVAREKPQRPD